MEAAGKATEAAKQAAAESAKKAAKKAKDLMDETGVTQAVEDYEFGDITRGAVGGVEKAVREATGKEDYKFGDITKNIAKNIFGGISKAADAAQKKLDEDGN